MNFKLYRTNDGKMIDDMNSNYYQNNIETLTYAAWLEDECSENRIMKLQDELWDMHDIYVNDDGKLYTAVQTYNTRSGDHFGEWAMWAEVEPRDKRQEV